VTHRRACELAGELRHGKHLGAGMVVGCALLVVVTVPLLHPSPGELLATHLFALGAAVVASGAALLPWPRTDPHGLLVFPVVGMAALAILASITTAVTPAYSGFFTLAFVYAGVTQPRGTSLALLPLAVPAWIVVVGGLSVVGGIRLAVAVATWVLVAEALSARTARLARRTSRLSEGAITDALTGLTSRRELTAVMARSEPGDTLVLVDLDRFGDVNDRLGHLGGDRVLAEFGACLRQVTRRDDVAIRYGGQQVLLILRQGGAAGADQLLRRLRTVWASSARPTFSAGVAVQGDTPSAETLRLAQEALHRAKRLGRNQWRYSHLEDFAHRHLLPDRLLWHPSQG
jgi:diguanylate cyclase (GGDEF)-like protein